MPLKLLFTSNDTVDPSFFSSGTVAAFQAGLGLGGAAALAVGTDPGTVAAGNRGIPNTVLYASMNGCKLDSNINTAAARTTRRPCRQLWTLWGQSVAGNWSSSGPR